MEHWSLEQDSILTSMTRGGYSAVIWPSVQSGYNRIFPKGYFIHRSYNILNLTVPVSATNISINVLVLRVWNCSRCMIVRLSGFTSIVGNFTRWNRFLLTFCNRSRVHIFWVNSNFFILPSLFIVSYIATLCIRFLLSVSPTLITWFAFIAPCSYIVSVNYSSWPNAAYCRTTFRTLRVTPILEIWRPTTCWTIIILSLRLGNSCW